MSFESEQAVLASILVDPGCIDNIRDILNYNDFSDPWHSMCYATMIEIADSGDPCDPVTVSTALSRDGQDPQLSYLADMAHNLPSEKNHMAYAEAIVEAANDRRLLHVGHSITLIANGTGSATDKKAAAHDLMSSLDSTEQHESLGSEDAAKDYARLLSDRFEGVAGSTGISTGYPELDEQLGGGMQDADLIIIAARPSMGKTTLALNICDHVAKTDPVLIFSMEMPAKKLTEKTVASIGRIQLRELKTGEAMGNESAHKLVPAISKFRELKRHIDDQGGLSAPEIRRRARIHKKRHGLRLVMIDYLQLVGGVGDSETEKAGYVSMQLKQMAKELECPVIALSQLNRSLENRADKRPINSDLRQSGQIEQDADVIAMIYRDEVYNPGENVGMAEVGITKNREGEIGVVPMRTNLAMSRFDNMVDKNEPAH